MGNPLPRFFLRRNNFCISIFVLQIRMSIKISLMNFLYISQWCETKKEIGSGAARFRSIVAALFTARANLFWWFFLSFSQSSSGRKSDVQSVSMVFTELFYMTIFLVLRKFLYNTLIHLVIRSLFPGYHPKKSPSSTLSAIPLKKRLLFCTMRS